MEDAIAIVERSKLRELNGLNLLPRQCCKNKGKQYSEEEKQETKDAKKLDKWKQVLKGKGNGLCSDEVRDYLDEHLLNWRKEQDLDTKAMEDAKAIVERAKIRELNGLNLLPRKCCKNKTKQYSEEEKQETKDAQKLGNWKQVLKGQVNGLCSDEVRDYLDEHLLDWRKERDLDKKAMEDAIAIVERAKIRELNGLNLLPRKCCKNKTKQYSEEEKQETKDAQKLGNWKNSLKGQGKGKCSDEVRDYLDENLPGWRKDSDTQSISSENSQKSNKLIVEEDSDNEEEIYILQSKPKKSTKIQRQQSIPKKSESNEEKKVRTKNELSSYHQKFMKMKSTTLSEYFKENPEEFIKYHKIRDENFERFAQGECPHEIIINTLTNFKTKKQKLVIDMGCGLAKIANHFKDDKRFNFINYDLVSSSENIEVCDISNMPFDDDYVDICIMSLALWGSNHVDYIKEAYRVLESQGILYIIDSTKRWSEANADNYIEQGMEAINLKVLLQHSGFKIVEEQINKFCFFKCIKL